MLKVPLATMHNSTKFKSERSAAAFHDEPVDNRSTELCRLTAMELDAVSGGPEVIVDDSPG